MGLNNFSCSCSNCDKSIFNHPVLVISPGVRHAFCSIPCLVEYFNSDVKKKSSEKVTSKIIADALENEQEKEPKIIKKSSKKRK